jgi:hypothetical protein
MKPTIITIKDHTVFIFTEPLVARIKKHPIMMVMDLPAGASRSNTTK